MPNDTTQLDPQQVPNEPQQPQGQSNDISSMLVMYLTGIEEKMAQLSQKVDMLEKGQEQPEPQNDDEALAQTGQTVNSAFSKITDRFKKKQQDHTTEVSSLKQGHSKELQQIKDMLKQVIES